jgi:[DsrC]-trisulfide reductase subunit J
MKRVGLVLGAALAAFASVTAVASDISTSGVPVPRINIAQGDHCVEPTPVMRRNHMLFILHQRDKTMHRGIRTKQFSLKNCVDCHASKTTDSVLGKDGFCQSCHTYAAINIDCFSCHSDKREPAAEKASAEAVTVKGNTP